MRLKYISEETLADLRTNYEAYQSYYYKADDVWFDNYFKEEGKVLESNIPFEVPKLNFDENYATSDRENVKILYEALKELTPSQATEERVWAGLAHLQLRDFTYYRLQKERAEKNDKRINSALFFTNSKKRSLFVHILARLWWVGYMTYDEKNKENPYWLTDFFCESDFSARCVVFFSSNFTSNRAITRGILRSIVKLKDKGVSIKRAHLVEANKYLNIIGGAMILDMLTEEEVTDMIDKHLEKVFEFELQMA